MSKVRIFVDYWNFQLNIIDHYGKDFRLDWFKLSKLLIDNCVDLLGFPLEYEGMNVYISFDSSKTNDNNLRDWANNVLDKAPGVDVLIQERKPKNPPKCPICHGEIITCPHCGVTMRATVEKGVDTAIVTDLISLAWENSWEYAVLVSSDKDFIPAVEMLNRKGFHVINAYFPPQGMELSKHCWASVDLNLCLKTIAYIKK
jgi:uncharacterized LabA/DUF88 family protein